MGLSSGRKSETSATIRVIFSAHGPGPRWHYRVELNFERGRNVKELKIRQFAMSDAQACCIVINAAVVDMDGVNEAARRHIVSANTPERLGHDLAQWFSLVAEHDGTVVGVGALDKGEIKRVYVHPAAKSCGIGARLLTGLEAKAIALGLTEVTLDASPSSTGFYEAVGYTTQRDGGFSIGDADFTYVTMTKTLAGSPPC